MDFAGCYNLLVSCIVSFNAYSNNTQCSHMEKAINCVHSEPKTCNHVLLRREMELLGFMEVPHDEPMAREKPGITGSKPNGKEEMSKIEKESAQASKANSDVNTELYHKMYIILSLLDQAKEDYNAICVIKTTGSVKDGATSTCFNPQLFTWSQALVALVLNFLIS